MLRASVHVFVQQSAVASPPNPYPLRGHHPSERTYPTSVYANDLPPGSVHGSTSSLKVRASGPARGGSWWSMVVQHTRVEQFVQTLE